MSIPHRMTGVLSPVLTPFKSDLSPDADRFVRHCNWLLENQVGLAVFGTNSEANSLSSEERMDLLDRLVASGANPRMMMPGTGCCSLPETVKLTRHAVNHGCAGVLMLPPFYYKNCSDEGLYRHYSEVIQRIADPRLQIYLYHIPPVAQVPITLGLIERLLKVYPASIAGIKDSSGDWENTKSLLSSFAAAGFHVFAGSETFLLDTLRHGGAGCISATANVNPKKIFQVFAQWKSDQADALQRGVDVTRKVFQSFPMIPAMKYAVSHWSGDPAWNKVRPPLVELTDEQQSSLLANLRASGFEMPGLKAM